MLKVYTDGLCVPPAEGIGCWAWVAYDTYERVAEQYGLLGTSCTVNEAEYAAVIQALKWLINNDAQGALLYADSQLIVQQVKGIYACRALNLQPLCFEAQQLLHMAKASIYWISRDQNTYADRLAKKALAEHRNSNAVVS